MKPMTLLAAFVEIVIVAPVVVFLFFARLEPGVSLVVDTGFLFGLPDWCSHLSPPQAPGSIAEITTIGPGRLGGTRCTTSSGCAAAGH
ncbi:hypothetical protein PUN4_130036 [Paraburkholderia unamae]|nr:hypothetical protein PUN4_130036 [Paraburkholderia unamae]